MSLEITIDKIINNTSAKSQTPAENKKKILDYIKDNGRSNCAEIVRYIELSPARTRVILVQMKEVKALDEN